MVTAKNTDEANVTNSYYNRVHRHILLVLKFKLLLLNMDFAS